MFSAIELFKGFNYPIPDTFLNAALGLLIVFAILLILVAIFFALGKWIEYISKDRTLETDDNETNTAQEIYNDEIQLADEESDEELVAVITAAIMAIQENQNPDGIKAPFIIKSIRRHL